jgi:CDP-glucose 4,6-dehydratase
MEGLDVKLFDDIYRNRRVLITGHTGFKGSWLALWLTELGARVHGLGLSPVSSPNHSRLLDLSVVDHLRDIRDAATVEEVLLAAQPEIVFHLAAQSLVPESYREPLFTWSTNVMGTANVLEACRRSSGVRAIVVVTTDKCYQNKELVRGYRETDEIGGHDPYSASKAAVEVLVASYRQAYFSVEGSPLVATARAGNVIGGGDWSDDRLFPDLVRAIAHGRPLVIRSPSATRPWQHVLDALSGYLLLGQRLMERRKEFADAWNFGPDIDGHRSGEGVLQSLTEFWPGLRWQQGVQPQCHETRLLQLDCTKANRILAWQPVWPLHQSLEKTATWYHEFASRGGLLSREQLKAFVSDAAGRNASWVQAGV